MDSFWDTVCTVCDCCCCPGSAVTTACRQLTTAKRCHVLWQCPAWHRSLPTPLSASTVRFHCTSIFVTSDEEVIFLSRCVCLWEVYSERCDLCEWIFVRFCEGRNLWEKPRENSKGPSTYYITLSRGVGWLTICYTRYMRGGGCTSQCYITQFDQLGNFECRKLGRNCRQTDAAEIH